MAVAIVLIAAATGRSPAIASTRHQLAAAPLAAAAGHTQREIFGFALASSLGDSTVGYPSWNFDLLSTVAFFGLHVGSGGQFAGDSGWNTWNSSTLTGLVSTAHQHGTRVLLTVILQDFSANTPSMCAGLQHADATVAQTVSEVKAKGVDGVNVDYEGLDGSCGTSDPYWAQHAFTTVVQKMRSGLGSSYYLSVDTYASSAADGYGFYDVPNLATYADSLFVMAYDLEYSNYSRLPTSCPSFCLGPTAPLSGYYYNDSTVAAQYVSAVGGGKVILGVPYYGRKACVGGTVPNAFPTSSVVADTYLDASTEASDPAVQAGSYSTHRDANSSGMERWDTWYNTMLGCTRELYWDDTVSLGKKYDLVNNSQLRGVGIWNLNYGGGATELWTALATHFAACTGVSLSATPAPPAGVGTTVTLTAAAAGCPNPLYEFWLRPAGSSTWQQVQAYSTSPTFRWNTTGASPGGVYLGVRARDASSSADSNANASIPYTVIAPCTSVSVSFTPAPPLGSGSGKPVTVSASTSGCPNPLYEFWMRAGSSSSWQLLQSYSPSATYTWDTSGAPPGTVYFGIWAKDQQSSATLDVNASTTFSLYTSCAAVSEGFSPASPVARGSGATVTVSASASGCPNPVYQFWLRPASSSTWQVVQAYSSNATYQWNTTGAPAGVVYLGVWAKDAGSPATVDSSASAPYTVYSPCGTVSVSFSPAPPQPHGTGASVTVNASASGCPNPVYQFWMRPATSDTWQLVQSYSGAASYRWNTTGAPAGTVYFGVWARDAASGAASDANSSAAYTLS